jgi:D-alanyl-D-alanine carboxypeptidase
MQVRLASRSFNTSKERNVASGARNAVLFMLVAASVASTGISDVNKDRVDGVVTRTMRRLGLPSVAVAIVQDGRIAYERAYGDASLSSRYEIGSLSKQFTAACILLLQQDGKLSVDDRVFKFVPRVTRAGDVTIRQLLTHTAGYDDYYATLSNAAIYRDSTLDTILQSYGERPLDFEPGTAWEYSNTDYAILAKIVEIASGMSYGDFVRRRIFDPLHMTGAIYLSKPAFGVLTIGGYERRLLGPNAIARTEGAAWLNGAAGLAMTVHDLALWDIALLEGRLLNARSRTEMFTAQPLKSGASSGYGFGWYIGKIGQYEVASHSGFVQGFSAENALVLGSGFAVAVLSNETNSVAPEFLGEHIAGAFQYFPASPDAPAGTGPIDLTNTVTPQPSDAAALADIQRIITGLQHGTLDRSTFTTDEALIATPRALTTARTALDALGTVMQITNVSRFRRGTVVITTAHLMFANDREIALYFAQDRDGRIADLLLDRR